MFIIIENIADAKCKKWDGNGYVHNAWSAAALLVTADYDRWKMLATVDFSHIEISRAIIVFQLTMDSEPRVAHFTDNISPITTVNDAKWTLTHPDKLTDQTWPWQTGQTDWKVWS